MLGDAPIYATIPCVDLEGARKFYGETLGLKEIQMPGTPEEVGQGATFFECGQGTNLLVYARPTPTKADHTAASWLVKDLETTVDQLISRGVKLEVYDMPDVEFDERGIANMGDFKAAWFKDPEGNILALSQMP